MKRYNPFYAAAMPTLALPRALKRLIVLLVDASLCVIAVSLAFYLRVGEWVEGINQLINQLNDIL